MRRGNGIDAPHTQNGAGHKLVAAYLKFDDVIRKLRVSLDVDEDAKSRHAMGKETKMAWKTPKIVEVPVGMEINMYACAARK